MKVSVLIGSRDRPEALLRCLESVLKQDYTRLEILVLDDNSSLYHLEELLTAALSDSRLRCFRSNTSLGVAGGRNFLMRQAEGDIFCIVDDDAYFAGSDCISQIVEAFEHHPRVGILASKVLNHRNGQVELLVPFSRQWRRKRPHLTTEPQLVSYYLGGCHAIRRSLIEQCGSYQSDLIFGEEELDLSYRAIEMGFEIMYLPNVLVHHHPAPSVVSHWKEYRQPELYYHVRNRFYLAYKYLPWVYIPVYLGVWLNIYGLNALKSGAFREFLGGVVAGVRFLKKLKRTPLNPRAVQYLKTHYGRLWY